MMLLPTPPLRSVAQKGAPKNTGPYSAVSHDLAGVIDAGGTAAHEAR
jgi:hypothetical protein